MWHSDFINSFWNTIQSEFQTKLNEVSTFLHLERSFGMLKVNIDSFGAEDSFSIYHIWINISFLYYIINWNLCLEFRYLTGNVFHIIKSKHFGD